MSKFGKLFFSVDTSPPPNGTREIDWEGVPSDTFLGLSCPEPQVIEVGGRSYILGIDTLLSSVVNTAAIQLYFRGRRLTSPIKTEFSNRTLEPSNPPLALTHHTMATKTEKST